MPNLLKLKRGTSATIPNGQLAEPLFTSDTYDLYVGKGNGSNQRFQKYIASGTSSQFLKGDGSLDSTSYQTALTFSSPLVNTSGTISIPAATGSVNGYLTSTDWTTFNNKQPLITAGTTLQYYRGDKTFQTLNTSVVPESGAIYFTEPRVLATVLTGLNLSGGGTIAATDSVLQAFGKVQNQISGLAGGVSYQGTWNASTNSPSLTSSVGTKGYYYVVNVAGSTNLNGITDWKVGDWAIFNGTAWDKVDNTDAVSSVNGFTGAVNLGLGDISNVTLTSPTNAQLLRFNGTSSKWENWTPTYISAAITSLNGLTAATQTFATGTTGTDFTISSSTSTHTFNIPSASATSRGLLTSGDYNTFALKQSAITLTTTGTSGAATFVGATLNIPNYGSALSGYLPLTGGTLTGSLFGTTASFTSNTSNFTLGSQVDTAIYMHFGTKNASGGYGIGHRIAGTINATANFDNLHGLWVDYTDNVGAYVGVVKYAIFQPDSAKQNYFGGTTTFNSFIWAQSTIGIGVNSTAYDLYIRKTAAYAMIESYTNSATSQLYFKGNNASSIAVTGGIIYTPSTSGNHNISITPDTSTSLGMILNTNSAGFGVIPKATTYYSLQSDYGVLSGNLAANISSNSYYNSGWKFYGTGYATLYNQDPSTGKHEFFTSASGSSGGSVSFGTAKFSIAQSGAATFSGALSGTSATFSLSVTGTTLISATGSTTGTIEFGTSATYKGIMDYSAGTGLWYFNNRSAGTNTTDYFQFQADGTGVLTIKKSGAATFSSSVTATSGSFSQSAGLSLQALQTAATNSTTAIIRQTGAGGNGNQDIGLIVDIQGANDQDRIANFRYYDGTNYNSRMVIQRGGNVGIGTSSPGQLLSISDANTTGTAVNIINTSTGGYNWNIFSVGSAATLAPVGSLAFRDSTNGVTRMVITSGGNVLIGTAANNWVGNGFTLSSDSGTTKWLNGPYAASPTQFYVTAAAGGGVYLSSTTATSWTSNSDIRLKDIIKPIENVLPNVMSLNPVVFSWKHDEDKKENLGLIAQELENIFPEIIDVNGQGMLGVRYQELVPVLVRAIQELKAEIDTLKK
jgi:hypothetical protein